jgi:trimethylamine---corrinoid protein Co-methyltransferase
MVRIARGIDLETLEREPSMITIVNTNSPLRLDVPMAQGMIEFALNNQPVVVTPFTLAGAMAPITLAGALAQQNAEALCRHRLRPDRQPGAPVMYGGFTSNVDMQSGAPAFGTPEYVRTAMITASSAAATACRTAPRTRAPPTPSTRRRRTRACSRCGVRSWAAPTS